MKQLLLCLLFFCGLHVTLPAQNIVTNKKVAGAFPVVSTEAATIVFDEKDDSLVQIVVELFRKDIEMITGRKPAITSSKAPKNIIIIGSIAKSAIIQQLIQTKKLNVDKLKTKWEGYQIQVVNAPYSGVEQALVITGSDRRGTAYGVLELSKQMGVSPWWWWADVPVKKGA
ncbi:MAG TPA: alpha-glucuronidase family glycosyl hydrolase, partial [Flavisolibacter sp.]